MLNLLREKEQGYLLCKLKRPSAPGLPKKSVWLLLMLLLPMAVSAQSISNYNFSTTTTGSLAADLHSNVVDMSTGTTTLIGPGLNSASSTAENIGFDFWNMGTRHTTFNVSSHGLLGLTTTIGTGNNIAGGAGLRIGALVAGTTGTNMATSASGKVHYKVVGTAPNRVLVIEWLNMSITNSSNTADATFQVRLYENSGIIEAVYGDMNVGAGSISTVRTGFSTATTVYNLVNTTTHTNSTTALQDNTYAAGPMTNLTSTTDGSRRTYVFTPAPVAAPTTLTFSNVGASRLTLSWTDNSVNETSFAVYRSSDNVNFNQVSSGASTTTAATGAVYSFNDVGLNQNTTYYYKVYALAEVSSNALSGSQATTTGTLCGTKTVGPTGDYATLTAAMLDLQLNGLSCPVILELMPGYTSAGETFPLTVGNIPTSATNTLTLRPQAGATNLLITSASAGGTINLTNGRYITIDGRPGGTGSATELTIQNTYAGNDNIQANAIKFISDASFNAVRYLNLKSQNGATGTNYGSTVLFLTSFVGFNPVSGNSNNIIENCNIGPVNAASAFPTYGIVSSGAAATPNTGNIIRNNHISDFFHAANSSAGVYVLAGSSEFTINGNNLYQTLSRTATSANIHYGIWINAGANGNGFTVANNTIGGSAAGTTGAPWTLTHGATALANRFVGINFNGGTTAASTIQGNTIANIVLNSSSGATTLPGVFSGIYVAGGNVMVGGPGQGNTIGSTASTGSINITTTTTGALSYGIGSASSGTVSIANNVVGGITTLGSSATISNGFTGILVSSGTNTISNNLIGSLTTANSIHASNASTSSTGQALTGIQSSSSTSAIVENNTVANLFNNYRGTSVSGFTRGIFTSSGVNTITGNMVYSLANMSPNTGTATSASVLGIGQSSSTAGQTVSQNTIHSLSNLSATGNPNATGIYYSGPSVGQNVISRNIVHSISLATSGTTATITGIQIAGGNGRVHNNMVRLGIDAAGNGLATEYEINGIFKSASASTVGLGIYFNSVYIGGSNVGATTTNTYAFRKTNVSPDTVMNNIFVNARSNAGATGGMHYAIMLGVANMIEANANIYFAPNSGGVLGRIGTTDYTTIADWRNALQQDAQSVAEDPGFINPTANATAVNLHLQTGIPTFAEGRGVAIPGISVDFDGENRSSLTPTDIGADAGNFTPAVATAAPVCVTPLSPANAATNLSRNSVTLRWNFAATGATADSYNVFFGTASQPALFANVKGQELVVTNLDGNTTYNWQVVPVNSAGSATGCAIQSFTTVNVNLASATGASRCGVGVVDLMATGSGVFRWYEDSTTNVIAGTGTLFSPIVSANTTYYVSAGTPVMTSTAGLPDSSAAYGTFAPATSSKDWPLVFSVTKPGTLDSVYVYPVAAGDVVIQLYSATGTAIGTPVTKTVTAAEVGQKTVVAVNFELDMPGQYRISNPSASVALGRFSTYTGQYPIASADGNIVVDYSVSSATSTTPSFTTYNSFFDLHFSSFEETSRMPVNVIISTADPVTIAAANMTICEGTSTTLTASSNNATYQFFWEPAPGLIATTGASVTVSPTVTTSYIVRGDNGVCANTDTITITVIPASAAGTATAVSASICAGSSTELQLNGNTSTTIQWQRLNGASWVDETGTGAQTHRYMVMPATTATYRAIVSNINCAPDTSAAVVITVNDPQLLASSGDTRCGAGTVNLTASANSGSIIKWYENASGGTAVATGTTFSPTVSATTTYYAEATAGASTNNVGRLAPQAPGATNLSTYGQIFTVTEGFTLNSVDVISTTGTSITISLYNSTGSTQLFTTGPNAVPANSTSTINLGWFVAPGTYRLMANGMTGNFIRENSTVSYPIPLTGVGQINGFVSSITGSTTTSASYYFMYNWNITTGCASARTAVVATVNPLPMVNLGGDQDICTGSTATLDAGNAGGGFTYLWNTGATTQTISAATAGTYFVAVTNTATGCVGHDTVQITMNSLPTVNLGADTTQCGGTVTLDAGNAGATYLWSDGSTAQTLVVSTTGTYSVSVTNTAGCTATDQVTVTIDALPTATITAAGPTTICQGGSVTLSAPAGLTYLWSTGETTQSISATTAGTYSVTTTNAANCTATDQVTVTVNALPVVNMGGAITQCGGTVTLDAGNPGATYLWSNGMTTQSITVATSGTYSVVVTNTSGCTANGSVNVTINQAPVVNLGADTVICAGATYTLNPGAGAGATYLWSNGATTSTLGITAAGTYWVDVTVNGCTTRDSVTVSLRQATTSSFTMALAGMGAGFTNTGSTGAGFTYLWNFGDGNTSTQQNPSHTYANTGSYTITLTVTGPCGVATATQQLVIAGVKNALAIQSLSIYPNPTNGQAELELKGYTGNVVLELYTISGQRLLSTQVKAVEAEQKQVLDLSKLPTGVYMLRTTAGNQVQHLKVVKE